MTLWHASTELQMTAAAVVAKTVHLAARYTGRLESGLCLGLVAKLSTELGADSAELDTSG
jgi:hypothetical protein